MVEAQLEGEGVPGGCARWPMYRNTGTNRYRKQWLNYIPGNWLLSREQRQLWQQKIGSLTAPLHPVPWFVGKLQEVWRRESSMLRSHAASLWRISYSWTVSLFVPLRITQGTADSVCHSHPEGENTIRAVYHPSGIKELREMLQLLCHKEFRLVKL